MSAILDVRPLGFPWQTVDPFLFCVHHDDAYPKGDERMAPAAAGRARHWAGFRPKRRLEHVPRRRRTRLPAAPAPRVRDGDGRAPRVHRSLRLAGRDGAFRRRRRAVAHRWWRHRALRNVSAARARARQPARAIPDLAESSGRRQNGRAAFHDAVERRDPARAHARRRRPHDRDRARRRRAGWKEAAASAAALVGCAARGRRRDLVDQDGAGCDVATRAEQGRRDGAHAQRVPRIRGEDRRARASR